MKSALLMILLSVPAWPGPVLDLTPSAAIAGQQATFVGWGYTLSGITSFYAVPTFSEFSAPAADGVYLDFVSLPSNFVVVPPGGADGQDFDPILQTGIGEFFIALPAGTTITGQITLHYDLYSQDPTVNPVVFRLDNTIGAQATIHVVGNDAAAVPEPATWTLALGALLCLASGLTRRHIHK